jgi:hypothetical protein
MTTAVAKKLKNKCTHCGKAVASEIAEGETFVDRKGTFKKATTGCMCAGNTMATRYLRPICKNCIKWCKLTEEEKSEKIKAMKKKPEGMKKKRKKNLKKGKKKTSQLPGSRI